MQTKEKGRLKRSIQTQQKGVVAEEVSARVHSNPFQ